MSMNKPIFSLTNGMNGGTLIDKLGFKNNNIIVHPLIQRRKDGHFLEMMGGTTNTW